MTVTERRIIREADGEVVAIVRTADDAERGDEIDFAIQQLGDPDDAWTYYSRAELRDLMDTLCKMLNDEPLVEAAP